MSDNEVRNVWAFEYCSCIYESGYEIVTLHDDPRQAYKAMLAYVYKELAYYETPWYSGEHMEDMKMVKETWHDLRDHPLTHHAWRVRRIEVIRTRFNNQAVPLRVLP